MAQNAKSYFKWLGSYKGGFVFLVGFFVLGLGFFLWFCLVFFGRGRCFLFGLVFLDAFLKGKRMM